MNVCLIYRQFTDSFTELWVVKLAHITRSLAMDLLVSASVDAELLEAAKPPLAQS